MGISSDEVSAHGNENHGMGDVDALLIITHETSPAHHPAKGAFDDPTSGEDIEPLLAVGPTDDFDHEVEVGGFVHELEPVVGAVGEQMLHPGPALAHAIQDRLSPGAVGDVDRKSTRLNSSHTVISYAVFCLKKK